MFREQDVTAVTAIHYPLRDVDPGTRDIRPLAYIHYTADRAAVHTYPQLQFRVFLHRAADFQRAFHRCLRAVVENQCHSVPSWDLDQSPRCFRAAELLGAADDLIQGLKQSPLLVHQQLGITDDVYEQDMRDL